METPLPAGSVKRVIETAATSNTPFQKETVYEFPSSSVERQSTSKQSATIANERPLDQTVAIAKIQAQERRYLLFIGIGLGVAGIAIRSLLPVWPGLSNGAFAGAALALAAWKLSEVPGWIWAVAVGVAVLLALGYKRGELDKNHNGIPDFLEKRSRQGDQ